MAPLLQPIFGGSPVPQSDAARARVEESQRLRELALDPQHADEIYDVGATFDSAKPDDLMPDPDTVEWANDDVSIYDDMARNVLRYGSLVRGRINVLLSLALSWLPGTKGDTESERVTEAVADAWSNFYERRIALECAAEGLERGYSPLENIWGVGTRGAARDLIAPVELINRPRQWFGFDRLGRPRFKRRGGGLRGLENPLVPDLKVTFLRSGSLHTPYGRGYGQDCYPAVWTIDMLMQGFLAMSERFGFMPMIITYPNTWKDNGPERARLYANAAMQWKNVFMLPGEVDTPEFKMITEGAFAAAGAVGDAKLKAIAKLEEWLSMYIQGSMYSSGNQQQGSFARDAVADGARLYKAPGDAACIEAMLNRGFVRPIMLINFPTLEESKWPRCVIDSTAASDLDMLIKIMESGANLGVKIADVTWSEAFKIPLAKPGDVVLTPAAAPAIGGQAPANQPLDAAAKVSSFAEQAVIRIRTADGGSVSFFADSNVYTENRGVIRASLLESGDIPVVTRDMIWVA